MKGEVSKCEGFRIDGRKNSGTLFFFLVLFPFLSHARLLFFVEDSSEEKSKKNVTNFFIRRLLKSSRPLRTMADEAAQLAVAADLPMHERAKSKLWKARVAAFEDIARKSSTTGAGGGADDEAGPSWRRKKGSAFSVFLAVSSFSRRKRDEGTRCKSNVTERSTGAPGESATLKKTEELHASLFVRSLDAAAVDGDLKIQLS